MKNLQISEQTARELWKTAGEETKKILIDTFGIEFFNQEEYESLITFEACCKRVGLDVRWFEKYLGDLIDSDTKNYVRLKVITKAINPKDWKPDFTVGNRQKKWYNVFENTSSGFVFLYSDCGYTRTLTYSSARLAFADEKRAKFAATHYLNYYKEFTTALP